MKTKILYVAMKYDYGDSSRGLSFEHRNFHDSLASYAAAREWGFSHYDYLTRAQQIGQEAMTQELYELAKKERPSVLFAVLADSRVDPYYDVFSRISDLGIVTVHWFCDDHWRFDGYSSQIAPHFDLSCTTANSALPKYASLGLSDRVIKSQWACNHESYTPFDIPRDIDYSFVGMPHGDRVGVINNLITRGLDVQVFGYGWQDRPRLPFNQMVRMFSRSKINLNLSNSAVASVQQIKGRNFEVPGCRAFLLTGKAEDLENYYEDGREVVTYDTLDDLVEKAKYYAEHDAERESIAQNAYRRTIEEHTWHHRYNQIFERALSCTPRTYVAPPPSAEVDFLPGDGIRGLTSIVILNLNGDRHIRECLDSIRRHTPQKYEIIVVDNASTDDSLEYLRAQTDIRLIQNTENVGVGLGRNQGLAIADGEYIVFLDNDTIVTDGWLGCFQIYAKAAPEIGIMGPRSNYVSGPQLVKNAEYTDLISLHNFASNWAWQHKMQATLIGRLVGFCQFIRREVIKKIGGTEPAFGIWGWDDDDLSLRAQLAGYKLAVAEEIFIHHTGSQTAKTADLDYDALTREKWEIFRAKWGFDWSPGQPMAYNTQLILARQFDPAKHGIALPPRKEIESLLYNVGQTRETSTAFDTPLAQQRRDDAINAINRHLINNPNDAAALNRLSMAYYEKSDYRSARDAARRAIDADPNYTHAYYALAEMLMIDGRTIEAAQYISKAINISPPAPEAFGTISRCLQALKSVRQPTPGKKKGKKGKRQARSTVNIAPLVQKLTAAANKMEHAQAAAQLAPDSPDVRSILNEIEKPATQKPASSEKGKSKLSLCMIARNEEAFLQNCLESAQGLVDEMILVDTGSTDRTPDIARECGAAVYHFEWMDDFSLARNDSLKYATGDWILVLDADEVLPESSKQAIRDAIENPTADAYGLSFVNFTVDGSDTDYTEHSLCRLFRNLPEYRFSGSIHENMERAIGQHGGTIAPLQAHILHYGYVDTVINERNKAARYTNMLEQEHKKNPADSYYMYHLANAYCVNNEAEKACDMLRKAIDIVEPISDEAPVLWAMLVNILVGLERPQGALEVAERSTAAGVLQHPQLVFCKGNALSDLGRYEEAIECYKKAIKDGRGKSWNGDTLTAGYKADYGIADALQRLGRNEEAIGYFSAVIESKRDHILAYQGISKAYLSTGQMDKYEHSLRALQVLLPEDPGPSIRLAEMSENSGDIKTARDIYNAIVAEITETAMLHFKLASLNEALGDTVKAKQSYLRAIELMPECKEAHCSLALILASEGDLEGSMENYAKAIEIDPQHANAYFSAGDVLYQYELFEQAIDIYSNGLTVDPAHLPALFAIGNCYFRLGAYDAAQMAYKQVLSSDPGHREALNNLSMVESALQQISKTA